MNLGDPSVSGSGARTPWASEEEEISRTSAVILILAG